MNKYISWFAGATGLALSLVAIAQTKVGEDFTELTKPSTEVLTLGPDLFGDQVSMYTGTVRFSVTDISLPGNNALSVALGRTVTPEHFFTKTPTGQLGNWELDIPHLHGVFAANLGWQTSGNNPNQRCSVDRSNYLSATPPNASGNPAFPFASAEYWAGNSLYVPSEGDKKMLVVAPGNSNVPNDGRGYYWVTADHWAFTCLSSTANGVPGEAFLAKSPNGLTYTFNWFAEGPAGTLSKPYAVCTVPCTSYLATKEVLIFPTRVEDRFGNWVTYTYDASNPRLLKRIESNDGRTINLSYNTNLGYNNSGRLVSAEAGGRVWRYVYSTSGYPDSLSEVQLPDGSKWSVDPMLGSLGATTYSNGSDCGTPPSLTATSTRIAMTGPSGARGEFTFTVRRHGRSYVPRTCSYLIGGASFVQEANIIDAMSIDKKVISGPGMTESMSWTYEYGPANGSFVENCTTTCPTTKTVTVTNASGAWEKHTFSNRYSLLEGKLLQKETGSGSTALRTEKITYVVDGTGKAYPTLIGKSPCYRCDKDGQTYTPISSQVLTQDGASFTANFDEFDSFARATKATASSSLGYAKTDTTSFADNRTLWVLGLLSRRVDADNGDVIEQVDYDTKASPVRRYVFGKLKHSMTYNSDGTFASLADGVGNTTIFLSWFRGTPTQVRFADGTTESATVNDAGWITNFTDRAGYATSYLYDTAGRLTRITYPPGDDVAWRPVLFTYRFVPAPELGIAAGHWRRDRIDGSRTTTTYFDALLRPAFTADVDTADSNAGSQVVKRYDGIGHLAFESYPTRGISDVKQAIPGTATSYDALDRVVEVRQDGETGPLITKTEYLSGFQRRTTDPRGNAITEQFQAFDTPDDSAPVLINAPEATSTLISRDRYGKPLDVTRAGPKG